MHVSMIMIAIKITKIKQVNESNFNSSYMNKYINVASVEYTGGVRFGRQS